MNTNIYGATGIGKKTLNSESSGGALLIKSDTQAATECPQ